MSLCSGKPRFPVFPCLSLRSGEADGLPYVFSFLKDSKRVDDISVCSAFYFLLGHSDDFKTLYMRNKKPKILDGSFFIILFWGVFLDVEERKF